MSIEVLGAFLSGVGAVVGAIGTLRYVRRQERANCQERIDEVKAAMREGYKLRSSE